MGLISWLLIYVGVILIEYIVLRFVIRYDIGYEGWTRQDRLYAILFSLLIFVAPVIAIISVIKILIRLVPKKWIFSQKYWSKQVKL